MFTATCTKRYRHDEWWCLLLHAVIVSFHLLLSEAEKQAEVAKITWEQKVNEKESAKKISAIEGE